MKRINANADSCANCFNTEDLSECIECSLVYCDSCHSGVCPDCDGEMEEIED